MDPRIRQAYRTLLYMGKEYPQKSGGYDKFRRVLKLNFQSTKVENESELVQALEKVEYIKKELESLYSLTRYRHLKRVY
ncbi:uncharacterized protein RJT21DRAFT_122968, partial [Scheffersomyces amazonensis]|uniref:uncharacterized protein n=1 Tax=Scheffersomyces amazonensis TaxID=1078765 RepID=UPI00315C7A18